MVKKDYYDILGVSKTSSDQDIKRAYRRLAIKYHPDRNKGDKQYEEKFKEIKNAYEILSNKEKRSMYDQHGHSVFEDDYSSSSSSYTTEFSSSSDFGDIFGEVFGDIFGSKKKSSKAEGSDLLYKMELSLEESVIGIVKKISFNVIQKCSVCYGSGSRIGKNRSICSVCKGKGNIYIQQGFFNIQQTCPTCKGSCYIISDPCYICRGSGVERNIRKISVRVPTGVSNGDRIRIVGKGNYGGYGASTGDLYIEINIKKHNIFTRDKNNLFCEIPINFSMAALGGVIEIPTLYGRVNLTIPKETQTGKLFRIKNKGLKSVKSNNYGDLLCKIFVETPVNLNRYQKKLLRDLGFSLLGYNSNERNNLKSKNFFNKVKEFFKNLTKY